MRMKIGFAKADITPQVGQPLAGYLKVRISKGIHSPLYARALVLKNEQQMYLWLSLDVIAIDHVFLDCLKAHLKAVQLHFDDIEVFATHTHSGPCGTVHALENIFGQIDEAYIKRMAYGSVQAIQEAIVDLDDFVLKVAQSDFMEFASSRHNKDIFIPNKITTVIFERSEKEPILLYHFACHPTILHEENGDISSDFVGAIEKELHEYYTKVIFFNGSCGNISTRFTREQGKENKEELQRLSTLAAKQILTAVKDGKTIAITQYQAYHFSFDLKKRKLDTIEEATHKVEEARKRLEAGISAGINPHALRILQSYYEGAQCNYQLVVEDDKQAYQSIPVAIIALGTYYIVCIPGELFHSLEENINLASCLVLNYANGYQGYIADSDAYKQGYYESMMSYYEIGEGEKLIQYINDKIRGIKDK